MFIYDYRADTDKYTVVKVSANSNFKTFIHR